MFLDWLFYLPECNGKPGQKHILVVVDSGRIHWSVEAGRGSPEAQLKKKTALLALLQDGCRFSRLCIDDGAVLSLDLVVSEASPKNRTYSLGKRNTNTETVTTCDMFAAWHCVFCLFKSSNTKSFWPSYRITNQLLNKVVCYHIQSTTIKHVQHTNK